MTRLFRLAIALLPLALGAAAAGAQEPPRPRGPEAGPRDVRPRESLMQRGRSEREMPMASRPEPARERERPRPSA